MKTATELMIIPHDQLSPDALAALIEEFVTRDGALHGHADTPVEAMVASVRRQLDRGIAVIVFDEATETASIVMRESLRGRESDELQPPPPPPPQEWE
jgi:uncharacterized protein